MRKQGGCKRGHGDFIFWRLALCSEVQCVSSSGIPEPTPAHFASRALLTSRAPAPAPGLLGTSLEPPWNLPGTYLWIQGLPRYPWMHTHLAVSVSSAQLGNALSFKCIHTWRAFHQPSSNLPCTCAVGITLSFQRASNVQCPLTRRGSPSAPSLLL